MTNLIDKIERLSAAATPGEWHLQTGAIGINPWISAENWTRPNGSYVRGGCILNMVAHDEREQDAALIVALRNAVPEILAALRAQQHAEALADEMERAITFIDALADNDPDEPIADNGMTVLGALQYQAPTLVFRARAALSAYRSVK